MLITFAVSFFVNSEGSVSRKVTLMFKIRFITAATDENNVTEFEVYDVSHHLVFKYYRDRSQVCLKV